MSTAPFLPGRDRGNVKPAISSCLRAVLVLMGAAGLFAMSEHRTSSSEASRPRERVAPAALPMDLISDQLDINGLLLNPEWQYQATNHEYPDVPKLCNVYDYHLAGCTTQYVTSNTQPNTGWNAGCNWPDVSSTFTSGLFAGHKNWFPVTVTGAVTLVSGYDDSWSAPQGIGWDAHMDFYVPPFGGRGLTQASVAEKHSQIGVEWDGYEVFYDGGDSPLWWNQFFKVRNTYVVPV